MGASSLVAAALKAELTGQADGPRVPGMMFVPAPIRVMRATPSPDDMAAMAAQHAMDPAVFEQHPPFFLTANISNNRLDAYLTRMHRSSLENYAADAEAGVAVLQSHNSRELPLGRSIAGRFVGAGGNGVQRVEADAYLMQGMQLGSVPVDQVVQGIRGGVVRDVSIGFYGGTYRCSICGEDYWRGRCPHVAGAEYQRTDANGDPTGDPESAFVWIHDAHLAEFSLVYDGATPGAEIVGIKAQQEADAGRLRPETARLLEARYRIHIPGAAHSWAGANLTKEERTVADKTKTATPEPEDEQERKTPPPPAGEDTRTLLLVDVRAALGDVLPEGGDALEAIRNLVVELRELRPLADTGRQYRVDLIDETLAEGVRAFGDGFPRSVEKASLERAGLDEIKAKRAFYQAEATKRFPGGRATADEGDERDAEQPKPKTEAGRVPDLAYAS